jgi:predicted nucleic acid-binding protein
MFYETTFDPVDQAIIVDTDIFSYWLKRDSRGEAFRSYTIGRQMALAFPTVGELYYWALKNNWGTARFNQFEQVLREYLFLPCDGVVCKNYAQVRLQKTAEKPIEPIGSNDYWIAACALKYKFPILTNNYHHFSRIKGIKILGPHNSQ